MKDFKEIVQEFANRPMEGTKPGFLETRQLITEAFALGAAGMLAELSKELMEKGDFKDLLLASMEQARIFCRTYAAKYESSLPPK